MSTLGRNVDRKEVAARIEAGGRLTGGYLMMIVISAAIAILGLLLSSPAVVIGAMLLSPLMGPIIALGFAFWTVDWAGTRRAVGSLVVGFGLALLVSMAIVAISPLKEPTSEILARSRPTLFDLLVAIFSGVAGGYAVVRHRGETVIGVAIATALMPPLATVGFGIGTLAWNIAGGALLLFFTNLVAIALAVAVVAALTGFRPRQNEAGRTGWLPHAAVIVVLALLCVPLTLSLRTIALESRATAEARRDIGKVFGPKARVASLTVRDDDRTIQMEGLVATPRLIADADDRLKRELTRSLHAPVAMKLDQVVLADPRQLRPTPAPAPGAPPPPDPMADLRAAVPFPGAVVLTGTDGTRIVRLGPDSGLDLSAMRALEHGLRGRPNFQDVTVSPPLQPLPPVVATSGGRRTAPTLGDASLQAWALRRWRAGSVEARLCRNGARPAAAAMQPLLAGAFGSLPVTLQAADRAACAAAGLPRPFLLIAPGPVPMREPPAPADAAGGKAAPSP